MATWDELNKKVGGSTPTTGGSSNARTWDALNQQSIRPAEINEMIRTANISAEESRKANSFSGLAKETVKEVSLIVPKFWNNLTSVWRETPTKVVDSIKESSKDLQQGKIVKGVTKAALRPAGDAAIAIFAPISAAIGAVLEQGGGAKLIDDTGKVIADRSGITDIPAFQKFSMEHPNAAADFDRIVNLATLGAEGKARISPKNMFNEAKVMIDNVRNTAPVAPKVSPETGPLNFDTLNKQAAERAGIKEPTVDTPTARPVAEPSTQVFEDAITRPSSLAENVRRDAEIKGIEADLGQSPIYETRPTRPFAERAQALVERDQITALEVARGNIPAPDGMLPGEVFSALKVKALESGDVALLRTLGTDTRIAGLATEAGRAVKAYDANLSNDPVRAISDLAKAREDAWLKRNPNQKPQEIKQRVLRDVKKEIDSVNKKTITPKTWGAFIKSIEC